MGSKKRKTRIAKEKVPPSAGPNKVRKFPSDPGRTGVPPPPPRHPPSPQRRGGDKAGKEAWSEGRWVGHAADPGPSGSYLRQARTPARGRDPCPRGRPLPLMAEPKPQSTTTIKDNDVEKRTVGSILPEGPNVGGMRRCCQLSRMCRDWVAGEEESTGVHTGFGRMGGGIGLDMGVGVGSHLRVGSHLI